MKTSNETKVGVLVFATLGLAVGFAWLIGVTNPFERTLRFQVTYNYAGGIEVGSPVRVSGIKVGKVEKIEFFVPKDRTTVAQVEPGSPPAGDELTISPLRLTISVRKDAAVGVKSDSRLYVNMAGIIGERYIEITPGSMAAPAVVNGQTLAGVDPPRFDQLISQSFDLAGKIQEIIDKNSGDLTKSIELIYKLSANLNKTLAWVDKSAVFKTDLSKLTTNLTALTEDLRKVTSKVHTPEGEKTLQLMHELLWRLEPVKEPAVRKFLQEEGMRVKFF